MQNYIVLSWCLHTGDLQFQHLFSINALNDKKFITNYIYVCVCVCVIKSFLVIVLYSSHPKSEMLVRNTLIRQSIQLLRPSGIHLMLEEI